MNMGPCGKIRTAIDEIFSPGFSVPMISTSKGNACEFDQNGTFHFDVEIKAPLIGLIVRYVGYLEPQ